MTERRRVRVKAHRGTVVRDFAIFQLKLFLDGIKDVVLSAMSLGAVVIDLLAGGGRKPRLFYTVLAMSERFDLWLNLSGAVSRLEKGELDEEGLFGASEAGSDSLLGKVEEMVRGGDLPRHLREKLEAEQRRMRERLDEERRRRGTGSGDRRGDGEEPR